MEALLLTLAPGAAAYGLYLWAEKQSKAEFKRYSRSSIKGWKTRKETGHYLKINDCMNDTTKTVWTDN